MSLLNQSPLICLITDRQIIRPTSKTRETKESFAALSRLCSRAAHAGIHLIQIREKDLPTDQLCELVSEIVRATAGTGAAVLVNDRADVALTCGAHGVHLRSDSLPVDVTRKLVGKDFIIGLSTHSAAETRRAGEMGADFALLGHIFDTPSKRAYGSPLGLEELAEAASTAPCPVLALGGIDRTNAGAVLAAGAAGIAAIRLFAVAEDLEGLVKDLTTKKRKSKN